MKLFNDDDMVVTLKLSENVDSEIIRDVYNFIHRMNVIYGIESEIRIKDFYPYKSIFSEVKECLDNLPTS